MTANLTAAEYLSLAELGIGHGVHTNFWPKVITNDDQLLVSGLHTIAGCYNGSTCTISQYLNKDILMLNSLRLIILFSLRQYFKAVQTMPLYY
jgi:hypothetical protein